MNEITSTTRYVGEISADNAIRLYRATSGDIILETNAGNQIVYEGCADEWAENAGNNSTCGIEEILACAEELADLLDAEGEDYAESAKWLREHVITPIKSASASL